MFPGREKEKYFSFLFPGSCSPFVGSCIHKKLDIVEIKHKYHRVVPGNIRNFIRTEIYLDDCITRLQDNFHSLEILDKNFG